MRKIFLLLFVSVLSLCMFGQGDVTVTWETQNSGLTVIGPGFTFLKSGDKVPSGTNLRMAVNIAAGARLDQFLVNDDDRLADMLQDKNDGEKEYAETDYMYMTTVNEDTHIKSVAVMKKFSVIADATGDGTLEVIGDHKLTAGDKVPFGSNVKVRAVPGAGQAIMAFTINGTDYLQPLLMSKDYTIGVEVIGGLMMKIEFTGDDREENKSGKIAWNIEGKGSISVKTASGETVERGGSVERGTDVILSVKPDKNASLTGFYINDDIYITRLKESGYELTMTVKGDLVMDAFFKSTGGDVTGSTFWIEDAANAYASGTGTQADPYIIETPEQLSKMAADLKNGAATEGKYYALNSDIDLKGKLWHPIGYNAPAGFDSHYFDGNFDGKGFKVKNLEVMAIENVNTNGLFGIMSGKASIKNLTIESGNVRGANMVGAIVGYNRGGYLENCVNYANVSADEFYAGGITSGNSKDAQTGEPGTVKNCRNYGMVMSYMCSGGICGSSYGVVEECANYGSISAPLGCVGGITSAMEAGTIQNCYNRGKVTGSDQVGGIIGAVYGRYGNCNVYSVYSASDLVATDDASTMGGIIGVLLMADYNYSFSSNAMYYDVELGTAETFGNEYEVPQLGFNLGDYGPKTTEEMKSAALVKLLNEGSPELKVWFADTENVNGGYPVIDLENAGTGIYNTVSNENTFTVTAKDGKVSIEGCPADAQVEIYATNGSLVCRTAVNALGKVNFMQGAYIAKVMGKSQKFIVR